MMEYGVLLSAIVLGLASDGVMIWLINHKRCCLITLYVAMGLLMFGLAYAFGVAQGRTLDFSIYGKDFQHATHTPNTTH